MLLRERLTFFDAGVVKFLKRWIVASWTVPWVVLVCQGGLELPMPSSMLMFGLGSRFRWLR